MYSTCARINNNASNTNCVDRVGDVVFIPAETKQTLAGQMCALCRTDITLREHEGHHHAEGECRRVYVESIPSIQRTQVIETKLNV